ncbi:FlaD/FlaE family flagellar protein [Halanaeroarchaeum sulfurireducens]|uniref:Flagella-related protein E n=1 Tax=Halanaeroarchaeum sulfurireducens TaxID=1604004 RepID=A0A0F7P9M3_9EURY|nr:FlaD/FlaE family flagellar protein [Halanaeroarchaeum sulfurireducens]AKH97836.1 flagella-related protein E [Halanaeroarchaeum sulfurireducens]
MPLVEHPPFFSFAFSFGVVAIGLASWLGGDGESDAEEIEEDIDDGMGMDDEFEMDDFDDDFGGMDGAEEGGTGANTTELENRIEDLESEIANVSSTANTVRSENEQISEKVDDVEENVRKLLEIYEMVTRGVNPFVDDVSTEAGMSGEGGSFGLFDDGEEDVADEPEEDLDSDIADAEAEDFFEDDAFDDEFTDEAEGGGDAIPEDDDLDGMPAMDDEEDEFDDMPAMDDDADEFDADFEEDSDTMDDDGDDSGGGGTSFEELKAEYESGDADWADENLDEETPPDSEGVEEDDADESTGEGDDETEDLFIEDDLTDEEPTDSGGEDSSGQGDADVASETVEETVQATDVQTEEPSDRESADAVTAEAESGSAATQSPESGSETAAASGEEFQFGAAVTSAGDTTPSVERPPDGYLADVVMLEWLDFLVDSYDARTAVRAINYYERIGWIGEPMRDHCVDLVMGITDAEYVYRDEFGTTDITMTDHRRSLRYVEELAGGRLERTFADKLDSRKADGI